VKLPSLLRLYPRAWRERYAEEMAEILSTQPMSVARGVDLLRGAVDAHWHPEVVSLDTARRARSAVAVMVLLLAMAGSIWLLLMDGPGLGGDLTDSTQRALVMQTATLALLAVMGLRLRVLDLSHGVSALAGIILTAALTGSTGVNLLASLPLAAGLGLAVALGGLGLARLLRVPFALTSLGVAVGVAFALSQVNVHLAIPAVQRLSLEAPSLALLLGVGVLAWRLTRKAEAEAGAEAPSTTVRFGARAAYGAAAALWTLVVLHVTGLLQIGPLSHGATLGGSLVAPVAVAAGLYVAGARLAGGVRHGWRQAYLIALPATILVALACAAPMAAALVCSIVGALALTAVLAGLAQSPAWATLHEAPATYTGKQLWTVALGGTVAGGLGALIGAQGVRDAGFLSQGSFLVGIPLLALVIAGQLVLTPGRLRTLAGLAGAVTTGTMAVIWGQPSDNLVGGLVMMLVLAAIAAPLWRLAGLWDLRAESPRRTAS
jgi:hypothetical protein